MTTEFFELAHEIIEVEKSFVRRVEQREILDFEMRTDESEVSVDVYIKPTKPAEYIHIEFKSETAGNDFAR